MHRIRRLLPVVVALVLAACAGAAPTPTPTDPPAATPTPAASAETPAEDPWAATAAEHRGSDGEQFTYECPAGGEPGSIWGTDVYTDDSSVCTAGVHAGVITLEDGGSVTIEIRPGEDEYDASEQNGIESFPYGPWGGSFEVVDE